MGTVYKRGQELGRGDLTLFLKAKNGNPVNAAEVTYDIYDYTTGIEVLVVPANRTPINPTIGEFYASLITPLDANIGCYRIRWHFRQYLNSQQVETLQEFNIVENTTQVVNVPGITPIEYDLVRGLRIMLRDGNPDRNYHFAPPTSENTINQFSRVFGFIWQDEELLEFLKIANDSINMYAPQTFYDTLDHLIMQHRNWRSLLLVGSTVYAANALAFNYVVEEFEYSIGGVSLSINKADKYQSLAGESQARFDNMVVAAKESCLYIKGLKQSRYGIGIRSSFGPSVGRGALTPRRFIGI
jgi:hypothetical protein